METVEMLLARGNESAQHGLLRPWKDAHSRLQSLQGSSGRLSGVTGRLKQRGGRNCSEQLKPANGSCKFAPETPFGTILDS